MNFNGIECVFCKKKFKENDDIVVCPVCGSPHHRECWDALGKCANNDLHGDDFLWVPPDNSEKKDETPRDGSAREPQDFQFKNGENTVQCPNCGTLNYGNDAYCFKCRAPLRSGTPYGARTDPQSPAADIENDDDFRQNMKSLGGLTPDAQVYGIPAEELSGYIGGRNPGKIIRSLAAMERFGKKISLSFAALIFGPIWFFYRKMYKEGFIYTLILLILSLVSSSLMAHTQPVRDYYSETTDIMAEYALGKISNETCAQRAAKAEDELAITVFSGTDKVRKTASVVFDSFAGMFTFLMAILAFGIYGKKMKKDIFRIRGECSDFPTYERSLREQGGTSALGAVLGILVLVSVKAMSALPYCAIVFERLKEVLQ